MYSPHLDHIFKKLFFCLDLKNDPPEGIRAVALDNHLCHWQATILGPAGSPYEGGKFFLYIQIPYGYNYLDLFIYLFFVMWDTNNYLTFVLGIQWLLQ